MLSKGDYAKARLLRLANPNEQPQPIAISGVSTVRCVSRWLVLFIISVGAELGNQLLKMAKLRSDFLTCDALPIASPCMDKRRVGAGLLNRNVHDFVTLYKNQLPFVAPDDLPPTHFDQVILVDSRSASLPKGVRKNATYRCIDHHPSTTPESDSARFQEIWCEALGATTTLVVERLLEQQLRPTALQATLLALGIHEDTGSLTFASTTARDVRALAWLLDCGANLAEINEFLHHPMSSEQRHLLEQLLAQSETIEVAGHSLVIAQVAAHSFSEALSPLASRLRDIFESDAIFLLAELGDMIQMVARSSTDAIDVGNCAQLWVAVDIAGRQPRQYTMPRWQRCANASCKAWQPKAGRASQWSRS